MLGRKHGGHYRVVAAFLLSQFVRQVPNLIVIMGRKRDLPRMRSLPSYLSLETEKQL